MNDTPPRVPDIDLTAPAAARVYDALLDGKDNFEVDRRVAEMMMNAVPGLKGMARSTRAWLGRVVTFLAGEAGVSQFLDIGSGLPTNRNVHQVAQETTPGARVVYVDRDPIVLAHGRALLAENQYTAVVHGDLRDPAAILAHPGVRRLVDFDEPVAVLLSGVLHFLLDEDDPHALVGVLRDALPTGSYLAISHMENQTDPRSAEKMSRMASSIPNQLRSRAEVLRFFGGLPLVEPGLVPVTAWRPDAEALAADPAWLFGGVARV
ncbi:SAM-dependent methyltransferase [Actinorugispora endophytica]|uniref:S-adenosyl methyltransferase n=1 Tax=Actinorugispora endophytica TaxID=1605990 RepID=A0A4R6V585_9ACTN|nr:SAM-dependent methyltransferase [Actinorugispora endophytica]TDQ53467.1 S-adenosyl methyltransferase [Actinorugispora endophytica]